MSESTHPSNWKYESADEEGFHTVLSPENSPCEVTYVYRLNLPAGGEYELHRRDIELNGAVVEGSAAVEAGGERHDLDTLDSFYPIFRTPSFRFNQFSLWRLVDLLYEIK